MSSIALPPELIETIVDEIGLLHDRGTLKACSLVSLAFAFPAQRHLFRAVDLDNHIPRKKAYQRFHRLLVAKPHLGAYVRELRLGDDSEDDFGSGKSWIVQAKTLPRTLGLLPRLEAFTLTFNAEQTNWKAIPAETRSALGHLFRLPSLQAVSLEFIKAFPPQLLLSLTRLKHLSLSCVETDMSTPLATYIHTRWESNLQSLFLRGTSPPTVEMIGQALASSPPHSLRRLAITPTFEHGFSDAVSDLIKTGGSCLTAFEWLPSIHFSSSAGSIDLGLLPQLRLLRFVVSFRKTYAQGPFPEVVRLLSQLVAPQTVNSTANIVESVTIDVHCVRNVDGNKLQTEWKPIDKVLTKPAFRRLKEVKVRLSTSTSSSADRHKFTLAFQDILPRLQAKGVLLSVTNYHEVEDAKALLDGLEGL
ncbi:unnamed protein product [Cyclocybe aegerita]|uniref:F-box domain-containing protein n=1 Tax=Cyclocybe aegerita TaxID=1973307 RepID=A0A8S0WXA4_CYCAE|nr:unnamed protein product [Cyclocybe aegerita]